MTPSTTPIQPAHYLFDWGDTLMRDDPQATGPMATWPRVEALPGAAATLRALAAGAGCHIATNARDSSAADIRRALDRVGLGRYITHIFCFREIGAEKPSEKFFATIVERLGCRRDEVVMVGDNLEKDVRGALARGICAIWLNVAGAEVPPGIDAIGSLPELVPERDV